MTQSTGRSRTFLDERTYRNLPTPAPHGTRPCDIGTVHDPHPWGVPAPWENRWRYDCPGIEPDIMVMSTSCCRMARSDVCVHGTDKEGT